MCGMSQVLGLFVAGPLLQVLKLFPTSVLAALLALSAFELAAAARAAMTSGLISLLLLLVCTHVPGVVLCCAGMLDVV